MVKNHQLQLGVRFHLNVIINMMMHSTVIYHGDKTREDRCSSTLRDAIKFGVHAVLLFTWFFTLLETILSAGPMEWHHAHTRTRISLIEDT